MLLTFPSSSYHVWVVAPHLCVAGCLWAAVWFAGSGLVSHVVAGAMAGGWGRCGPRQGGCGHIASPARSLPSTDVFICTSPIKMYKYCPFEKVRHLLWGLCSPCLHPGEVLGVWAGASSQTLKERRKEILSTIDVSLTFLDFLKISLISHYFSNKKVNTFVIQETVTRPLLQHRASGA